MKNIKKFQTEIAYTQFSNSANFITPNVSLIESIGSLHYNMFEPEEYVDLGLPSGTLWRKMNVGAEKETDYGNYYTYGGGSTTYEESHSYYNGQEDSLPLTVDTAAQVLGNDCHTPTEAQCRELAENTIMTYEENFNGSGIEGAKFTSKIDSSKYIFLPFSGGYYNGEGSAGGEGCYWTNAPGKSQNMATWFELWNYEGYGEIATEITTNHRSWGYSVRPVKDAQ